jgi:phosphatidylserine/phosphatidylglycerophosphate/cardiolipin synthase-like enzyme
MHAKTICVDGEVASIGSANFDIRVLSEFRNECLYL